MQSTSIKRVLFDVTVINKNPVLTLTKRREPAIYLINLGIKRLIIRPEDDWRNRDVDGWMFRFDTKTATLFFIFFGWSIFILLVPTCRIIFFGFRLITGFAKSTMSSMVAPEKEKALTFWFLDNFLPMMFLVIESPMTTTSASLFWTCLLWLVMLLPEATPLCPARFFFFFGCTVSHDLEACCTPFRSTAFLTPCYPLVALFTPCYPLLPLLPPVTLVTPCYPLLPLLPLVTLVTPCYPLLPLLLLVTPCYPLLPLLPPVTLVTS